MAALTPSILAAYVVVCSPVHCSPLPQVETEDRFEWIGGSSIGGGTFWGLGALLTKTKVFPAERRSCGP